MTTESPRWFKSSHSSNGGNCIEVADNLAATHGTVPVRDSKNPTGPVLNVPTAAFPTFVAGVTTETPRWFTSTHSGNGGDCIEVAANLVVSRGVVPVRDSKNPTGPVLNVPTAAFATFVAGVRAGDVGTI